MYQESLYVNADDFGVEEILKHANSLDKGHNVIKRRAVRKNGMSYIKQMDVYSSGGTGSHIRDAETGDYTPFKVGSEQEDRFFKVILATGEARHYNTLFYYSPQHYSNHMGVEVDPAILRKWEEKNL